MNSSWDGLGLVCNVDLSSGQGYKAVRVRVGDAPSSISRTSYTERRDGMDIPNSSVL